MDVTVGFIVRFKRCQRFYGLFRGLEQHRLPRVCNIVTSNKVSKSLWQHFDSLPLTAFGSGVFAGHQEGRQSHYLQGALVLRVMASFETLGLAHGARAAHVSGCWAARFRLRCALAAYPCRCVMQDGHMVGVTTAG